jgi:iron complex outermembrane recepter protein
MRPAFHRTPLALAVAVSLYGTFRTAVAAPATSDDAGGLQEIIVTASRRDSTVLDTPYSIQAISAQDLEKSGVSDINGLVRLAPGLSMFDEGPRVSGNRNSFSIRGLNAGNAYNNDDNPSLSQSAVSTYLGETPVFFPFKLVDLERVEVLRGPQGTLYGGSSIGGTIRFMPNAPDPSAFTADLNAKISTTEHASSPSYDWNLTVNAPLNENNAVRATIGHEYLSGFINANGLVQQTGTAMHPGGIILQNPADFINSPPAAAARITDYNMADLDYFRGAFLSHVTERVKVTLNLAYQQTNAEGRYEDNPYYGSGREYQFYKAFTDPQSSTIRLYDVDVEADLGFATLSSSTSGTNTYTKSASDSSGYLRTNLASYYAGYPRLYVPLERDQHVDTYSEELRLASKSSAFIEWVGGAFVRSSHTQYHLEQDAPGINEYTNEVYGLTTPLNFTDVLATGYSSTTFKDFALFGELTAHLTDKWQVTGGARVFHDTLRGVSGIPLPYASLTTQYFEEGVATNPYLLGGYYSIDNTTNDHIFKFDTSYQFTPDVMAYAIFSQGYRPGGANALPALDPLGDDNRPYLTFRPDTDNNYEIGVKGRLSDRLTYTATAFLVDWKNFQTTLYTPFGLSYVANVAPARSQGVELELKGNLTPALSVGVNYTYIDAYLREGFNVEAGQPSTYVPAGSHLPGTSKNTYSVYAEYTQPLPGSSALQFRVDQSYRSHSQSNFNDIPSFASNNFVSFSSIALWNSSVAWSRGPYTVAVFGENLSDNRGTSVASAASYYGDRDQGYGVIRPRTFGIRFNWQYR